jgi:hypothetical protein
MAFRKPPVILKSNTVTLFKNFEFSSIITGLWNILQNHRRLPECPNNNSAAAFGKISNNNKCFIEANRNLKSTFLCSQNANKIKNHL